MSQSPEETKIKFPGPTVDAPPAEAQHTPYEIEETMSAAEKTSLLEEPAEPEKPTRPLNARQKEACRLRAHGRSVTELAEHLGYNRLYLYTKFKTAKWRAEVARCQDRLFESDVMTRLKALGPDSVDVIEELLRDPQVSALKKADKAQWVLEKLTGKAKQEHSVESNTLAAFTEVLRQMQQSGETLDVIDVTTQSAESRTQERAVSALPAASSESKFSKWVDEEI